MPSNVPDNQKAQSPSKLVQRGIDQTWQPQPAADPKEALADRHTKKPVTP